ncbi:MAG: FAD-dependent oxidoreductase [Dehalococcoidia bacterium]|nr:FAD-dependent oxidoreductase [Dehalococcoidia bacterium]
MQNHRTIFVCQGTGCLSSGSDAVYQALMEEISRHGIRNAEVDFTGCHGFCEQGPNIVIEPEGIFYTHVQAEDAPEIVTSHLRDGKPVERLFYHDPVTGKAIPHYSEINFYKKQHRVILRNCGRINPEKIEHYIASGGYQALRKALLEMTSEQVINEVKNSGLRGRGGAGFPAGRKWESCRRATGKPKYVICNADEGDPGAFMDRSILEADPHSVLEGMTISAYAIGSQDGYIYVRAEYPLAVKRLKVAVAQAREHGFLGRKILETDFCFDVDIVEGAGAFVCGESTALMASIEGRRGMPRQTPPRSVERGLGGKPTLLNNVKTFAFVPQIISNGADWFASIGTEKSKGTAVFALTGKIANSGLVEVPMGTPLSTIIFDVGGGIPRHKQFKAVQTGGPSGGCIPARFLDSPVEYETLAQLGSIMGSGGMVVLDETTCMVDVAKYFLSFTQAESCGKCVPCRLGTKQMLEILTRITQGKGREQDIDTLLTIAKAVKECSLCGLGQSAPNPVLTTLNYFRDEYETHIKEKRCSAAVCDALMISPCQHTCPVGINIPKYVAQVADGEYLEAINTIRERNPFPAICGRICHHPCEGRCRRGELDDPVAIRALKRFAADWYFDHVRELSPPEPFPQTHSQKVAVVGAGPTGLSCAYFLAQMGYPVTLFEALPLGGGMLSVAIPDFRLPREVIEKEIEYIEKRGVEIKYSTPINVNFTIENIRNSGFQAVFIAAGAQRSQNIGIPGELEDVEGFYYGLRFLRDVKVGKPVKIGRRVAVIGGGNVALDSSRTALRLGADEVNIFYRRSREEMPVTEVEYDEALAEGIQVSFLVSPTRIVSDDWKVTGLQCIRMRLGEPEASGRRRPIPVSGSEFFARADTVIAAVGQAPDLSFLPPDSALERTRWERLAVDENKLVTSVPGIFAGGDFVSGPGMVIEAVAAGRRGAIAIDKYLRGDTSRVEMYDLKPSIIQEEISREEEESWEPQFRPETPHISLQERKGSFKEIELSFSEEKARQEARRCLRCDLEK